MRLLGLDIGDKTVGIAISDPLLISAHGVETLQRVGIRKDTTYILDMCQREGVDTIVAGLPLMLNGSDSPQTQKVREFVKMLENKIMSQKLGIKVVFQDERFTTKIAEDVLIQADMRREKRKQIIDRQAAVIILTSYMDGMRFRGEI